MWFESNPEDIWKAVFECIIPEEQILVKSSITEKSCELQPLDDMTCSHPSTGWKWTTFVTYLYHTFLTVSLYLEIFM